MKYRLITSLEPDFRQVAEKIKELGEPVPNLALPVIAFVAEEDGQIKDFAILQCIPLIEPFTTETNGGMRAARLFAEVKKYIDTTQIPRVIMHTRSEKMGHMLTRAGATPLMELMYDYRTGGKNVLR